MDPVELLELCQRIAERGAPLGLSFPRPFEAGDYEAMWRRDPKRVRRAVDGLLVAPHAGDGLEALLQSGCLDALFPELAAIKGLGDDPGSAMHKDVWDHTKKVVEGVPAALELRWGALVHDVGKARTRAFDGRKVTFHNHDVVGARMVERMDARLGLFHDEPVLLDVVRGLVLNHLRPASYSRSWTDSGVRRLVADLGGPAGFRRLMALSRADLTTKNPRKRATCERRASELEARVAAVLARDGRPRLPKGTMGIVMSRVAAPPGPWLNAVREELEAMMAAGLLEADREAEHYVTKALELVEAHAGSRE